MKDPHLSGIAKALAAQGRKGDDTLIHVSKKELAALQQMGDGLGIHLTKNPVTGLPEAFNWLGALGGVAGGIIGTIIMPGAGTAAGAALGSGLGTAAGGGSAKEALMAGVIGGITGYAGAGIAGSLASAGEQAVAQTVAEGVTEGVSQTATQGITQGATDVAAQGVTQGATDVAGQTTLQQLSQGATQNSGILQNLAQQGGENLVAEGSSKAAGSVVGDAFVPKAAPLQSTPLSYGDKLTAGWNQVTSSPQALGKFASDNAKGLIGTGMGIMGVGAVNPSETTIATPTTETSNPYSAEWYTDPATGQQRTRAVRRAAGGGAMFSDYDAADVDDSGGYAPGGVATYATGGISTLGDYSDGGRLLKGPGDGVSDNIPATIEGKRPARLADGEFVVPARAVSELGNGSTEAGSKQLYKMLDRIAEKRKTGKGLAYEANPKKLLPA